MNAILDLFRDSAFVNIATLAMSIVAILLSVLSYVSGRRTNQKLVEIEQNRDSRDIEDSKTASLVARLEHGTNGDYQSTILIENKGEGAAREIELNIDGGTLVAHTAHFMSPAPKILGPMSTTRLSFITTDGDPNPRNIKITWKDDTGGERDYESTL